MSELRKVIEFVRVAWRAGVDLKHHHMCGPGNVDMDREAPDDPRCDCGVRQFSEAVDALCRYAESPVAEARPANPGSLDGSATQTSRAQISAGPRDSLAAL